MHLNVGYPFFFFLLGDALKSVVSVELGGVRILRRRGGGGIVENRGRGGTKGSKGKGQCKPDEPDFQDTVDVDGALFVCVTKCEGEIRLVADPDTCTDDELPISWGTRIEPSSAPSDSNLPSSVPSELPSISPSDGPSTGPSSVPSILPSSIPSTLPSAGPSSLPSVVPSSAPSGLPSDGPSSAPSDTLEPLLPVVAYVTETYTCNDATDCDVSATCPEGYQAVSGSFARRSPFGGVRVNPITFGPTTDLTSWMLYADLDENYEGELTAICLLVDAPPSPTRDLASQISVSQLAFTVSDGEFDFEVECPVGYMAIGGGFVVDNPAGNGLRVKNFHSVDGGSAWRFDFEATGGSDLSGTLYASCLLVVAAPFPTIATSEQTLECNEGGGGRTCRPEVSCPTTDSSLVPLSAGIERTGSAGVELNFRALELRGGTPNTGFRFDAQESNGDVNFEGRFSVLCLAARSVYLPELWTR
jgi:hypothetical protein